MRAVVYSGAGGNEVVAIVEREDPVAVGEEVLVAVRYAGINPADLQQRDGHYPPPPGAAADIPGLEVAGEVLAVGERVLDLHPGDRVMGIIGGGGLADRVVVHGRCVVKVPDSLSEIDAAAIPEAFITAHDAIRTQAGLSTGEVILVNGATGGVGTAAVQIAVATGATVLGVTRTEQGRELLTSLGAIAVYADDVAGAVADASGGRGADVVLELVGAVNLDRNFEVLASKGRIAIVGVGGGATTEINLRTLMLRRARLFGTVLRARPVEEKAAAVRAFEREVLPHLAAGRIAPVVDRAFAAEVIHEAFDHMEHSAKRGKVLLDLGPVARP